MWVLILENILKEQLTDPALHYTDLQINIYAAQGLSLSVT
jgi:hypothetical protein